MESCKVTVILFPRRDLACVWARGTYDTCAWSLWSRSRDSCVWPVTLGRAEWYWLSAHTHTHSLKPLVRLFSMNESWELCMSQLDKEIDIDDWFDLCHTNDRWETHSWSVFAQMHRSHDVASIRNWQLPGIPVAGNRRKSRPFDCFCWNCASF